MILVYSLNIRPKLIFLKKETQANEFYLQYILLSNY